MIAISIFEWVTILTTYAILLMIIYYQFRAIERRDKRLEALLIDLVKEKNEGHIHARIDGKTRQRSAGG